MALTIALCQQLLAGEGAVRIHGGGFAGTALAFVPNDKLERFKAGVEAILGAGHCHMRSSIRQTAAAPCQLLLHFQN